MIFTSGRSEVLSLVAPKSHGFIKIWISKDVNGWKKSQEKRNGVYTTYMGEMTLLSMMWKWVFVVWALMVLGKWFLFWTVQEDNG